MASSTSSPNASKGIVEDTINIDGRTISNSPLKIVDAVSLGAFSSPYNLTDNEKGTLGIIFNGPSWSIGWNERTDSDGVLQISDIGESDGFKADQYVISTKRGYAHAPGGTQYIPAGIYCEGEVVSSAWLNDELTGEQSNESSRITPGLVETATVNASVKVMAPQVQLGSISTIEGGVSNNDSYVNITTDHMTFNTDSIDISGDLHVIDGSDDYLGATQVITIPINGGQSVTFTFVNGILVNYNNGQQTLNPGT